MKDKTQIMERYQRLRQVGMAVTHTLVKRIPREIIEEAAQKLGLFHKNAVVLGEESEAGILMDFALHDMRRQGRTTVERFLLEASPPPGSDERVFAEALSTARFSLYVIEERERDVGVHVRDLLGNAAYFVMDRSMSQTAPVDMVMALRLITPEDFAMTTGAGLPVGAPSKAEREKVLSEIITIMGGPLRRATSPELRSEATATILNALLQADRSSSIRYTEPGTAGKTVPGSGKRIAPATVRSSSKPTVGKYDPCPCGSGKQYKWCCWGRL